MQRLAKLLTVIKKDSKLFKNPEVNFILGLTTSQVKDLKKIAIKEELIEEHKREFILTKAGEQYINEVQIISWVEEINNKRPEINLEYLKLEKTPPTVTKAIRSLARHLLEGEDLKENSTEHYLVRELLCSKSTCEKVKKEIEQFVLQNNKFKLTCLFERFMTPPYGLTKSIISVLLLDVLARNKDILAIYENSQFQLKLTSLMFDRMIYCPQNFELQKTVMEDLPILEKVSEIILPCKSTNILDLTKGLIYFIKNLDKYTLTTERLGKNTIRFRNAVLNAKDPINLFYKDIPKILDNKILCQCDKNFVKAFDEAIKELQNSYANLIKEISTFLLDSFNEKSRKNLAKRFEAVQEFLSDNELKILHNNVKELNSSDTGCGIRPRSTQASFLRPIDHKDTENSTFPLPLSPAADLWIERIATFINKSRVPKDWSDNDVADFKIKVKELALKFTTIEATACIDFSEKELSKEFQKLLKEVLNLNKSEKYLLMKKVVNM